MKIELNTIYNENCEETMKRMKGKSIDIVLTSPPYNMTSRKGGYADSGRYDVYDDWMSVVRKRYLGSSRLIGLLRIMVW